MTGAAPDDAIPDLEADETVPPRPEEEAADEARALRPEDPATQPVAGGQDDGPPAQGRGEPDSY